MVDLTVVLSSVVTLDSIMISWAEVEWVPSEWSDGLREILTVGSVEAMGD